MLSSLTLCDDIQSKLFNIWTPYQITSCFSFYQEQDQLDVSNILSREILRHAYEKVWHKTASGRRIVPHEKKFL